MKKDTPYLRLVHDTKGGPTDLEIEKLQRQIEEHNRQLREDEEDFHPHLWRKVEREKPEQTAALALVGTATIFRINLPHNIPRNAIPRFIRRDFQNNNGSVPFFGRVTGYYLHQRIDRSFEFDTDGNFLAIHPYSPPHYGEKMTIEFD